MEKRIRKAQYAGSFYPGDPSTLKKLIGDIAALEQQSVNYSLASKRIIGGVVPHAGLVYSAYEAVHFYEILSRSNQAFDTVVIVNPNHSGVGHGLFNTCGYSFWETPLGMIDVDEAFSNATGITACSPAHIREHSGEVQLPFLRFYLKNEWKAVIITMNSQTPDAAEELAFRIREAEQKTQRKIIFLASSDFSHYETKDVGYAKDQYVIDPILELDAGKVYREVKKHQVSACGYGPIMTLIDYARLAVPDPKVKLLRRGHSGEVSRSERVVDYVSFLFYQD